VISTTVLASVVIQVVTSLTVIITSDEALFGTANGHIETAQKVEIITIRFAIDGEIFSFRDERPVGRKVRRWRRVGAKEWERE